MFVLDIKLLDVNPLSLISTIVDYENTDTADVVNPLSLISTIVDQVRKLRENLESILFL